MIRQILDTAKKGMEKCVGDMQQNLATIRTGRASISILDHIQASYYGTPTPLNQMASLSTPDPTIIVIQPWDKSNIGNIQKALQKSELGLNPASDGNVIRLAIPPLSEQRRQELVKLVRRKIEERKVIVRNLRQEGMKDIKNLEKDKEISEDESKRAQDRLQKLTDATILEVDRIGKDKEKELSEV